MKFRQSVYRALRQRNGLSAEDTHMDKVYDEMELEEVLDEYLHWEGIYGYTASILSIVNAFYKPEAEPLDDDEFELDDLDDFDFEPDDDMNALYSEPSYCDVCTKIDDECFTCSNNK